MAGSSDSDYQEMVAFYNQSLDALVNGSVHVSSEMTGDIQQELSSLSYDLDSDSLSQFEKALEMANFRLKIAIEYRKSYADRIFTKASKDFAKYLSAPDRGVLTNVRKLARDLGPDDSRVRVLVGFAYPTASQAAMAAALDSEVWLYLQETADKMGPDHPKIRSVLTAASSARAGVAMAAALDERVWKYVQESAEDLGPEHAKTRSLLAASSAPQVRAAMAAALDQRVWLNVQAAAGELGVTHHRVRSILSAASTQDVADVMLGLLHRINDPESLSLPTNKFFASRRTRYIERITQTAAESDERAEWLTREDPEVIETVINLVRQIRQDAVIKGKAITDSDIYIAFYRDADYQDGHHSGTVRVDRTRPFQIVAALMGGTRTGHLPF
jgi:predicted transcriptional regulator